MSDRPPSAASFARAIAKAIEDARGRAGVLSPQDWDLIQGWHARGVPLALILEAIDEAAAPRRGRRRPASPIRLARVAAAIEESWGAVLAGRAARHTAVPRSTPSLAETRSRWGAAAERAGAESPLAAAVGRLLRELEQGSSLEEVDAALDAALLQTAPPELLHAAQRAIDAELARFRGRMGDDALRATRDQAVVDRLRRELDLPRLRAAADEPR